MSSNWHHTLNQLIQAFYILRPFYIKFLWGHLIYWGLFLVSTTIIVNQEKNFRDSPEVMLVHNMYILMIFLVIITVFFKSVIFSQIFVLAILLQFFVPVINWQIHTIVINWQIHTIVINWQIHTVVINWQIHTIVIILQIITLVISFRVIFSPIIFLHYFFLQDNHFYVDILFMFENPE